MNCVNVFYNIDQYRLTDEILRLMSEVKIGERIVFMGIEFDDYDIEAQVECDDKGNCAVTYFVCRYIPIDERTNEFEWESDGYADEDRTDEERTNFALNCTLEELTDDMIRALVDYVED